MKKIQGAVLMIGSLFWEDSTNCIPLRESRNLANKRSQWREDQLEMSKSNLITLHIRYGRKSSSRHCTYTMACSNLVEEKGKGYCVPYKHRIDVTENFNQIYCQALELAKVEGISKNEQNKLVKKWGSVGLKLSPKFKMDNPNQSKQIEEYWSQYYELINNDLYRIGENEESSISKEGILNFEIEEEEIQGLDYFLATPVSPNVKSYPDAEEIANAMNSTREQYFTYFLENYQCGIRTKDDAEIVKLLPKKLRDSL